MKNSAKQQNPGYILIVTLMVISLCVALISYVFTNSSVFAPYMNSTIAREKAKLLAQSGIQLAIAQLAQEIDLKKNQGAQPQTAASPMQAQQSPDDQAAKEYLERIVPTINRWQVFDLKEDVDGIDGQIKFAITAEDGKIDINQWYDFKNHSFKGDDAQKKISKALFVEIFKRVGKQELFDEFEKFLKARQYRLDDVTELLQIKGFEAFKSIVYYQPPAQEKKAEQEKSKVYLTDLFTVWSGKLTLDPWVFSDSISAILGLKQAESNDSQARKKTMATILKNYKKTLQFPADWKTFFEPLYQKELASLPKGIESIFSTTFEPKLFSILSHAKVGDITQRMLAIVESNKEVKENVVTFKITIKRIFWL